MDGDDLNYYSIAFLYKHAKHGESFRNEDAKLIIHVSYSVDERDESDKLSHAIKQVDAALDKINLDFVPEYCWPDGSLIYLIRTNYGIIELTILLKSVLNDIGFEMDPISPLSNRTIRGITVEQYFDKYKIIEL